ncbi:MAG: ABC transporter permease [Candidatus Eisenbacteria bacterium]|nr:ABC transporter permease [Candidatus Eisenbacteria bacterium]
MHAFYFREAWRSFKAHRGLALTTVFSLTAALTLSALFLLVSWNASQALRAIGDRREMVVYLKDETTDADVQALQEKIGELFGAATYVSRQQAWDEFSQQVGDADLLRAVDTNPLPASLRVKLKPELQNFVSMDASAKQIGAMPGVEAVRFGGEWVRRLDAVDAGARNAALAVGLLVALAIVFVLHNTLRLTVLARRQQVEIMSRLGASDRFVATPFLLEALLQTLLASLVALGLIFALQQVLAPRIEGLVFLPPLWSGAFLGGSLLLTWAVSAIALARVLRSSGA